jgi:hypothetical protein
MTGRELPQRSKPSVALGATYGNEAKNQIGPGGAGLPVNPVGVGVIRIAMLSAG